MADRVTDIKQVPGSRRRCSKNHPAPAPHEGHQQGHRAYLVLELRRRSSTPPCCAGYQHPHPRPRRPNVADAAAEAAMQAQERPGPPRTAHHHRRATTTSWAARHPRHANRARVPPSHRSAHHAHRARRPAGPGATERRRPGWVGVCSFTLAAASLPENRSQTFAQVVRHRRAWGRDSARRLRHQHFWTSVRT